MSNYDPASLSGCAGMKQRENLGVSFYLSEDAKTRDVIRASAAEGVGSVVKILTIGAAVVLLYNILPKKFIRKAEGKISSFTGA